MLKPRVIRLFSLFIIAIAFNCSGPVSDQPVLNAEVPLYLEEHLDAASIVGSEVPKNLPAPVEWRFDEPQLEWKPVEPVDKQRKAVGTVRIDDALRLILTKEQRAGGPRLGGAIYISLPDWNLEDWAYIEIKARTSDPEGRIVINLNYTEEDHPRRSFLPFYTRGDFARLNPDDTVQTYLLSLAKDKITRWEGPWTDLGIAFISQNNFQEAVLDIISVKIVPHGSLYAENPVGVKTVERGMEHKSTLYTHAPGSIEYSVRIPQEGFLEVALGVAKMDSPVTFRIICSQPDGQETKLLEEIYADPRKWGKRSLDLSNLAGETVKIALMTDAPQPGSVAFWAEPTISGKQSGYTNRKDWVVKNLCAHYDDEFEQYLSQANSKLGKEILTFEKLSPDSTHRIINIDASHFELGYLVGLIRNQHSGPLKKSRTLENQEINLKIIEMYKAIFPQHLEFVRGVAEASGLTIDDIDFRFMEGNFLDFWNELFRWEDFLSTLDFRSQVNCSLLSYYIGDERRHIVGRNWDQGSNHPEFIIRTKMKDTFEVIGHSGSNRIAIYNWCFDGVNETGLFLGLAGNNDPRKFIFREPLYPDLPAIDYGYMIQIILETCSTVDQAIEKFGKARMWFRNNGTHILIADKYGNSAVVEWDVDKNLVVFRNKQHFAAMTNAAYQEGEAFMLDACWRYEKAMEILPSGITDTSAMLKLMKSIQQFTGINSGLTTTLTCVYDLSVGKMEAYFKSEEFAVPHVFSFN